MTTNAIELLLSRRSCVVKSMVDPGPTAQELEQILEIGLRVPDHGKLWPWRIQVVDKVGQAALGVICADRFLALNPDVDADTRASERLRPSRAPLLLVVTSRIDPHSRIPAIEQQLSGGAVCQNLLNGAHALGYVAQWLTEWPTYDDEVKAALGHDSGHDMIGWIHVGSASVPPPERARATIDDVVSLWDAPGSGMAFNTVFERPSRR